MKKAKVVVPLSVPSMNPCELCALVLSCIPDRGRVYVPGLRALVPELRAVVAELRAVVAELQRAQERLITHSPELEAAA